MIVLSYVHFTSFLTYLVLAAFVLNRNPRSTLNRVCTALLLCFATWSFGVTFVHAPHVSGSTALLFENIGSIGWILFSPVFLWFTMILTGRERVARSPVFLVPVFLPACVFAYRQWTGRFLANHTLHAYGWLGQWPDSLWSPVYYAYYISIVLVGLGLVVHLHRTSTDLHKKRQAKVLVATAIVVFVLGTLSNVVLRLLGVCTIPPVGDVLILIWAGGVVFSMTKYQFLSITPTLAAETIVNIMSEALLLLDPAGKVVSSNRAALRLLEYKREELQGQAVETLFHKENQQDPRLIEVANQTRRPRVELLAHTRNGKKIPVEISLSTVPGSGIVCVVRDITLRKETQNKKVRLESELFQIRKMEAVGKLAGGIAHDFNNILGAISGYAEMLVRKLPKDNPKLAKYAQRILDAACHAADLTGKLLAFARKGQFETVVLNMHDTISDVVQLLESTVDLRISILQDLRAVPPTVLGDPSQIRNVLLNLGLNARDALPEGGEIRISTEVVHIDEARASAFPYKFAAGNYLLLRVEDNGTGMDEETRKQAFEPFFTTKEAGKGTGLGLASAYGTVKNHGGAIEIRSRLGEGTVFDVYLPSTSRAVDELTRQEAPLQRGNAGLLVVDDERLVLESCVDMLSDLGYQVSSCTNGREAVEHYAANRRKIDLVLTDVVMPELSGPQCLAELRKINPNVRVLVMSGYMDDGRATEMLKNGALGMLQKPFSTQQLSAAVARALANTSRGATD